MKWFVFAFGLASTITLAVWLRQNPRQLSKLLTIIGALPLVMGVFPKYQISIIGDPGWPGYTQGFDVSIIDLVILASYLSLPRGLSARRLPFKLSFVFYLVAVLISAFQAPNETASFYYVWQLLRMFMVYVVVARACEDTLLTVSLLNGMAMGLCFQFCIVLWQRFVLHYLHVSGTFIHQNDLGFSANFVIFPFLALLLSGRKEWQPRVIPVIGITIDIITASRAAVAIGGLGFSVFFLLSILRKRTARKIRILGAAIMVIVLLSPLAYRQFELRFNALPLLDFSEEGGRTDLNKTAEMILTDHPWGIGANNFFVVADGQGYYKRANIIALAADLMPHNLYWLTVAETGYVGLAALMILLLRPLLFALSCGWHHRTDQRGELLLGLATSLSIVYIQSYFEWIFVADYIQYFFAIEIGMIAALAQQIRFSFNSTVSIPQRTFP